VEVSAQQRVLALREVLVDTLVVRAVREEQVDMAEALARQRVVVPGQQDFLVADNTRTHL
jgi:hypothetical protein